MPHPDDVFRNGVTLLAFVMAFYALVARERKTPYMVHAVYTISLVVLLALLLSLAASVVERRASGPDVSRHTEVRSQDTSVQHAEAAIPQDSTAAIWAIRLQRAAGILLAGGLVHVLYRLWKDRNRHIFFRDDQLLANSPPGRLWAAMCRLIEQRQRYEHNPMSLPAGLLDSLGGSSYIPTAALECAVAHHRAAPELSLSAVFEIDNLVDADRTLADIAARFLENNCFVQYTTCNRHPIEFLMQLRSHWTAGNHTADWKQVSKKLVVVDAFTPHFGFTDSIYAKRSRQARDECLAFVTSKPTYAGIHTSLTVAFNRIKKSDTRDVRTPTLVIYEGCGALIDLESPEQYRIFMRHVLPSERLWGGMFTMVVETAIAEENRAVLKGGADIFVPSTASSPSQP